ncbi:hypothetical protein [Parablautia muri]|nr:hypothetical protein [Parablautia muri]
MNKKKKLKSTFMQELHHDLKTLKSLPWKKKIEFFWDYYKWPAIAGIFIIITICTFAHMFYEGQKPCRLRVCVVLNTDENCSPWFQSFIESLQSDGKPGAVDINLDQPFDYGNMYYYVQEIEVMTTISSGRMDMAICSQDMYSYLLALNACLPLDQALSKELVSSLLAAGKLVYDTANLQQDKNGNVNPADGIDGYYAVTLSETEFSNLYNRTEDGTEPLYAVIISNTEHLDDCESLLRALIRP